jgi:hypothetical protein
MTEQEPKRSWGGFSDSQESEIPEYRTFSGLAVVGFVLGLLAFPAMAHLGMLFIAAAAVLVCSAALIRIGASPSNTSGRGLAIAGLLLAVFWSGAGIASRLTHGYLMDVRSRELLVAWFDYLADGEPAKALELRVPASSRQPLGDQLLDHYLSKRDSYETYTEYLERPEIRSLLHLGRGAQVRHYVCEAVTHDTAYQIYAVTYDDEGTKKTFFIQVTVARDELPEYGVSAWRIKSFDGPVTPDAYAKGDS